jgi:hypothetical protein
MNEATMRWFTVDGRLTIEGKEGWICHGVHANDLPPGQAGLDEVRRRVIAAYHEQYGYPLEQLAKLRVREADPSWIVEGPLPFLR